MSQTLVFVIKVKVIDAKPASKRNFFDRPRSSISLAFERFAILAANVCSVHALTTRNSRSLIPSTPVSTMKIAPKIKLSYFELEGRAESMYVSVSQ
jgi:hypothetical protein